MSAFLIVVRYCKTRQKRLLLCTKIVGVFYGLVLAVRKTKRNKSKCPF